MSETRQFPTGMSNALKMRWRLDNNRVLRSHLNKIDRPVSDFYTRELVLNGKNSYLSEVYLVIYAIIIKYMTLQTPQRYARHLLTCDIYIYDVLFLLYRELSCRVD